MTSIHEMKLRTPKNLVKQISKKSGFRRPFDKQYGRGDQTLLKPESSHLYHIYWSLLRRLSQKKSFLETCKILGLCVKTSNVGHNYSQLNRENLKKPIQMQLPQKQTLFFQRFSAISKFTLNFEYFPENDDPHSWCVSKIPNAKERS